MTLTCPDLENFMVCITTSVKAGLMFKADAASLTIIFTGGF